MDPTPPERKEPRIPDDEPPFSRVFVAGSKEYTEKDFSDVFKNFGNIQYCRVLRDKVSGEGKGLAYIKYDKASSAALAVESMHSKPIGNGPPLKVSIAEPRGTPKAIPRSNEPEDNPPHSRLFITCSKDITEQMLLDVFQRYGDFEYCKQVKDKTTHTPKGIAYVKYSKSSTAARAMEEINAVGEIDGLKIKVLIAEPKSARSNPFADPFAKGFVPPVPPPPMPGGSWPPPMYGGYFPDPVSSYPPAAAGPAAGYPPMPAASGASGNFSHPNAMTRLFIVCNRVVTKDQLIGLFSRFPGLEYVDLKKDKATGESKGFAYANYTTPQAALLAKDTMDGFEFPAGCSLKVMFAEPPGSKPPGPTPTGSVTGSPGSNNRDLPDTRNFPEGSRLFLVLSKPLPEYVLQDIFCRFGVLEYVKIQPEKNYGYVKYTTAEAAQYALQYLNGTEIHGIRLKLTIAEPPSESRKRARTDT